MWGSPVERKGKKNRGRGKENVEVSMEGREKKYVEVARQGIEKECGVFSQKGRKIREG
ncbi:MAG TPA: hypothetical protein PLH24_08300 [Candidatus Atribacteria bacterium]|nr:hypothetical protein [Candidatus Atribacteria bacterium]